MSNRELLGEDPENALALNNLETENALALSNFETENAETIAAEAMDSAVVAVDVAPDTDGAEVSNRADTEAAPSNEPTSTLEHASLDVPPNQPSGILRPNRSNEDEIALNTDPQPNYGSAPRHASFARNPSYRRGDVPMRSHSDPAGRNSRALSLAMRIRTKDWNTYHQRKIYATGMMDVSLFTANANQLRYVIDLGSSMDFYMLALVLLLFSITLQLIVGGMLISVSRYDVSKEEEEKRSSHINDWMLLFVFLLIVVNVFISAFILDFPSLDLPSHREFSEPL